MSKFKLIYRIFLSRAGAARQNVHFFHFSILCFCGVFKIRKGRCAFCGGKSQRVSFFCLKYMQTYLSSLCIGDIDGVGKKVIIIA